MRLRSLALATILVAGGTAIGATTQHLATASVSSGNRPVLVSITPCRLADTRPAPDNVGPRALPIGADETVTVDARQAGTDCSGQIPLDASALSLNITALRATELSYLTVWPGGDRPLAASLNPAPGQPPVPNAVTTLLSVDQEFQVYNESGSVDIVVDVNGYYVDHDHDDRYALADDTYTKAEIDGRLGRERVLSFPAAGLNHRGVGTVTRDPGGEGLRWENSFVGAATIEILRPPSWDGASDVVLAVDYHRTTNAAGVVAFFARPDSQTLGDDIDTGTAVAGSENGASGQNLRRRSEIVLPADQLDNGEIWKIGFQRSTSLIFPYPDDVIVSSATLTFQTAG